MRSAANAELVEAAGDGFRPDAEGLRAVAVALVLLYHASVPKISAGYIGGSIEEALASELGA